ncbi:hypothetical protein MMC10_005384 [Thelotrema lepadinum]|nr:hypothetical protein [Thelotrema lepadinum]
MKGEAEDERIQREIVVQQDLLELHAHLEAKRDFKISMRLVNDLWENGAVFPQAIVWLLSVRLRDYSLNMSVVEKEELIPFAKLMVDGVQKGRMPHRPGVLMFLLQFFVGSSRRSEASKLSDWALKQPHDLIGPETIAAIIRHRSDIGFTNEQCEDLFMKSLKKYCPPNAILTNKVSEFMSYARTMSPKLLFEMIEVHLRNGNLQGAALDFEAALYGWPTALHIEAFFRLWLKYRPEQEAQLVFDLLTRAGNPSKGDHSVLLFREYGWLRGTYKHPSTSFRESLAKKALQNTHRLLSSQSEFGERHMHMFVKAVMDLPLANCIGGSFKPFPDWHRQNQDLLMPLLSLQKVTGLEMNDELRSAIICGAGRIGDAEIVRTYLPIGNPETIFVGSFGNFLFALGRTKNKTELEWWWNRYLKSYPQPHFKNLRSLMRATVECGNLPFFVNQLEALRETDQSSWIPSLEDLLRGYMSISAELIQKQSGARYEHHSAAVREVCLAISAMIVSIDRVVHLVQNETIWDLKNNPVANVPNSASEKWHEKWSKDMYDQMSKDHSVTSWRLHGETFRSRTNFTPAELRPYFRYGIDKLLLMGSAYDRFMWEKRGLGLKRLAEYHAEKFGEFDVVTNRSLRDTNLNTQHESRDHEWYEDRRSWINDLEIFKNNYEREMESATEAEYKNKIISLRQEPGYMGP